VSGQPTDCAPTDMELMMLLDGELDGDRRAEVEAFLAEAGASDGDAARGKFAGMRAVSTIVASHDWSAPASTPLPIDVADLVMAAIGEPASRPQLAVSRVAEPAVAVIAPVVPASPAAGSSPNPLRDRPANDNSRSIFGFALAAAAAAAALFFWGKSSEEHDVGKSPIAMSAPPVDPTAGDVAPIPSNEVVGALAVDPQSDPAEETRYGVEVASVDFGTRTGAIYYVPAVDLDDAATKAAVTTVVWLNDD